MNKFIKSCPQCGKLQLYSCNSGLLLAIRKNTICNVCSNLNRKIIPENGVWKRVCKCGTEMIYSCRNSFNTGKRTNAICRKCAVKESSSKKDYSWMRSDEYIKKMSQSMKKKRSGETYGELFKQKCKQNALIRWANPMFREKINKVMSSYEYRQKHKNNTTNLWKRISHINHMKHIHNSDEYKQKRRIITQNILKIKFGKGNLANVNKKACEFIDKLNIEMKWNLIHALNGGEYEISGYSLDGYDKEKNIVFEYDESRHYGIDNKLKEKDIIRQNKIINNLIPTEFWRYNERQKKLYNVLDGRILCLKV